MLQVAPGVLYRHLTVAEVLQRQRAQWDREAQRHNAGIVEQLQLEPTPPRRDQVREEFAASKRLRRVAR